MQCPVREQNGNISQWFPRFDFARREGWLNRSIPCLGMLFGKSDLNPTGWAKPELRATMQELKDKYPEMPGIGFCERSTKLKDGPIFQFRPHSVALCQAALVWFSFVRPQRKLRGPLGKTSLQT